MLSRPIVWTVIVVVVAMALAVFSSTGNGDNSKHKNLQSFAQGELAKLQILEERVKMPNLQFASSPNSDDVVTLEAFSGKVVLLNLWATWCAPCVKELPSLDRLQKQFGGPDFEVVALSLDRGGFDKIIPFYKKLSLENLALWSDPKAQAMRTLKAGNLPITILIDREGYMIARLDGPAEWDSEEAKSLISTVMDAGY